MMLKVDPSAPYRTAARLYADAGWAGVIALPEKEKWPPPEGFTGHKGAYPTDEQIERWVRLNGAGNIGLRLDELTTGIDVDDYDGKTGGDTFRALIAAYGPLPATWVSTSRRDGTSGIRLYRLPQAAKLNDKPGPGIEIIQRHHRYVVCWPSIHPDTGDLYGWITPDGELVDRPPRLDELPELPMAWFVGLQAPKRRGVEGLPLGSQAGARWTPAVEQAFGRAMAELAGGRHDAALHGTAALVRLHSQGYPGAGDALQRLETAFLAAVGDRSSEREAAAEWRRMLDGADELIRTTPSTIRPYADLVAELRERDDSHPIATPTGTRHSVKDKLPEPEPPEIEWDVPVPLGSLGDHLPRFPIHVFPSWIRQQAVGVAEELNVPVDLAGMLALGALSTIAHGHATVAINSSWVEHLNLYLVTAMPPGGGKSPAAKRMLRPVKEYEKELIAAATPAAARYEQEQRIREKLMRKAEDQGDITRAAELLMEMEAAEPVVVPELTIDDTTHSAMVEMLNENHGRASVISTEGGLFDQLANSRFNDSTISEAQIYLKGFSADWHKDRRTGRGRTNIEEAIITICITMQPAVVEILASRPELRGIGLTARFMYSIPPNLVGWRDFINARPVDELVAERYRQTILNLARDLGRYEAPRRLRLTPEATTRFLRWHQDMEPRRRNKGDLEAVAEWSEKLRVCVVRVAGLLHLADGHDDDQIGLETLDRALEVAGYWLEHAKAVHDLWAGHHAPGATQRVLDWLSESGLTEFTARDCYRSGPVRKTDQVRAALEQLEELGWVRQTGGQWGRGGRNSPSYVTHPVVTQRDTAPSEAENGSEQSCVTPVSKVGVDTGPYVDPQVGPGEDTESDRGDVLRRKESSALKCISELSFSVEEDPPGSPRERMPKDTLDTGTQPTATPQPGAREEDGDPCPVCATTHPPARCPAQL